MAVVSNHRAPRISWKPWNGMEFFGEAGWDLNESRAASRGAAADMILCLGRLRVRRRIGSFVNKRPNNFYGSDRVDCRYTLRNRSRLVASLHCQADPPESGDGDESECVPDLCAIFIRK
jgi:hypothetical protein